jgi:hypothetical protein
MFFDLGVFLAVAGASMLALTRLGRLGEPQPDTQPVAQGGLR